MTTTNGVRRVDLRSDTVTHPSPAMRQAMYDAELGDDVLGDDPTVQRLEAMAAERMGKEAAMFVASGTMGNLVALLTHCRRGDEAIIGSNAHIINVEIGGASGLGGIQLRLAKNDDQGRMDLNDVRSMVRKPDPYGPKTAMISIENTHNFCNGSALPASYTSEVAQIARDAGAAFHIDGARIFNAAIALETTPAELAKEADTITFCLSKGLACPIGSVLCGSAEWIQSARRNRRMVGGAMRQVGVIAAAGIVALDEMVERLADDHANARALAEGIATIPGLRIDTSLVQTNIIFFQVEDGLNGVELAAKMKERGVLFAGGQRIRMVTHYGIERDDIDYAVENLREVAASLQ